ncbi:MAG: PAS domain-containing protein [Leptonema sp. (in: bacteria)]
MNQNWELIEELFFEGPIVVFHWLPTVDWKVAFVTKSVEELTGYSQEEWIESKIVYKDIVHPDDLPRVQEEVYQNSYQNQLKRWKHKPYRILKKNKEEIWVQDYTICTYTNGIPNSYYGFLVDITKEYLYERDLEYKLELYYNLFEKHSAVMLVIDSADGKILNANESACKFYGYTKEEFQKMFIQDLNTLSSEEIYFKIQQVKSKKQNFFLFKHKLADSTIKDVEVYSSPIPLLSGKTLLFSIVHDISEKIQTQENLKRLHVNLENLLRKANSGKSKNTKKIPTFI